MGWGIVIILIFSALLALIIYLYQEHVDYLNRKIKDLQFEVDLTTECLDAHKEMVEDLNRNTVARIIEPFERDMNALQEIFDWHYCHPHSGGKELTDEELENLDFDTFSKLMIKIDWKDYPDQTERLERQAKRIEENKEKQRTKNKNKKKTEN